MGSSVATLIELNNSMHVTIKNVPWKFKHGLIRKCCRFVLSQFLSPQKLVHIEIEVVGTKGLMREQGAMGFCSISDDHFGSGKRSPVWFLIELDTEMDFNTLFQILCHELVHVKQYASKELRETYYPKYRKTWKGKDITDRYYSNSPHEQEAYRKEMTLREQFFELGV